MARFIIIIVIFIWISSCIGPESESGESQQPSPKFLSISTDVLPDSFDTHYFIKANSSDTLLIIERGEILENRIDIKLEGPDSLPLYLKSVRNDTQLAEQIIQTREIKLLKDQLKIDVIETDTLLWGIHYLPEVTCDPFQSSEIEILNPHCGRIYSSEDGLRLIFQVDTTSVMGVLVRIATDDGFFILTNVGQIYPDAGTIVKDTVFSFPDGFTCAKCELIVYDYSDGSIRDSRAISVRY